MYNIDDIQDEVQ